MTMSATYEIAGRTVVMPVVVRDAAAGSVMFDVDADAARALLSGVDFDVVEHAPGRTHAIVVVIDYRDNDLGDYNEVGLTLLVTPRRQPDAPPGTFIYRLPVTQAFTCEAGQRIWGFPKTIEDISIDYGEAAVVGTLRMDGELVFRLTLPSTGTDDMPELSMTSYTYLDGVAHATAFTQSGSGCRITPGDAGVLLELGEHPVAKELRTLGLPSTPVLTTWTAHMRAVFEAPHPL